MRGNAIHATIFAIVAALALPALAENQHARGEGDAFLNVRPPLLSPNTYPGSPVPVTPNLDGTDFLTNGDFLPDMNGDEVCRILKEDPQTSDIPVIIVSSGIAEMSRKATISAGVNTCPSSPIVNGKHAVRDP